MQNIIYVMNKAGQNLSGSKGIKFSQSRNTKLLFGFQTSLQIFLSLVKPHHSNIRSALLCWQKQQSRASNARTGGNNEDAGFRNGPRFQQGNNLVLNRMFDKHDDPRTRTRTAMTVYYSWRCESFIRLSTSTEESGRRRTPALKRWRPKPEVTWPTGAFGDKF